MDEKVRQEINNIMGTMQCPKNFKCAQNGFNVLCRAQDIGLESFLECLEAKHQTCTFTVPFGRRFFCRCPLRVHLRKTLKK